MTVDIKNVLFLPRPWILSISLLLQIVEPIDLFWKCGLANPHTSHCLGSGQIMISTMGDPSGNGKGKMLCSPLFIFNTHFRLTLLFMVIFKVVLCCWMARLLKWLATGSSQVKQHPLVMTSGTSLATTSWSALSGEHPKHWETASTLQMSERVCVYSRGSSRVIVADWQWWSDLFVGHYGQRLHVWDWTTHKRIQTLDLGEEGAIPLEIRFLHNPAAAEGFVGCALQSTIFRFYKTPAST